MKKSIVLIFLIIALITIAILLAHIRNKFLPYNSPYRGGTGGGSSMAEWSGHLDLR